MIWWEKNCDMDVEFAFVRAVHAESKLIVNGHNQDTHMSLHSRQMSILLAPFCDTLRAFEMMLW